MLSTAVYTIVRSATLDDAELVHQLYVRSPKYFERLSAPTPTLSEVSRELEIALADPCRQVELILSEDEGLVDTARVDTARVDTAASRSVPASTFASQPPRYVVGYLDYKLNFPEKGDTTVNLLLVGEPWQRNGYGARAMRDLETRLQGKVRRVLASVYGQNLRAKRFWASLGYSFAIDAKPVLDWYAKYLETAAAA
jgi:ribosomal protein S18 acetylase RimI-like enzyme